MVPITSLKRLQQCLGVESHCNHWYLAHPWWVLVLGQAKEQSVGDAGMGMKREQEVYGNHLVQNFHFLAVSGPALSYLPKTRLVTCSFGASPEWMLKCKANFLPWLTGEQ